MEWNEKAVSPLCKTNLLCGSASLLSLHIKTRALVHSPRKEQLAPIKNDQLLLWEQLEPYLASKMAFREQKELLILKKENLSA